MHRHVWILLAVIALIAAHGAFFYFMSSHIALSAAMVSGVIVLLAIKLIVIQRRKLHGSVHLFRRHSRH
jgi:hypothetical protein